MNKFTRLSACLALVVCFFAGAATAEPATCTAQPPPAPSAPSFSGAAPSDGYQIMYHSMWEFIRDQYYDPTRLKDWQTLEHAYDDKLGTIDDIQLALKYLAEATGDKWTNYITAKEMRDQAAIQKQGLVIGGLMLYRRGAHYQLDVIHYGSAAYGTALRERDSVICLNKVAIDALSREQVDTLLRGHSGDTLLVTALSAVDGSQYEVSLTLAPVPTPVVEGRLLPGNIIYMRMPSFAGEAYISQFVDKFVELSTQAGGEVKGMVLDLRNNLGGELPAATKFSSLFLDESQIVTQSLVRGKPVNQIMGEKADQIVAKGKAIDADTVKVLRKLPLVILANGSSASAAEITLGALKDNHRGIVFGVTSFGKGVGYKSRPGPIGGLMSLTALKYLTPAGNDVHEHGIDPDVSVLMPQDQTTDIQLDAAIARLNKELGHTHNKALGG